MASPMRPLILVYGITQLVECTGAAPRDAARKRRADMSVPAETPKRSCSDIIVISDSNLAAIIKKSVEVHDALIKSHETIEGSFKEFKHKVTKECCARFNVHLKGTDDPAADPQNTEMSPADVGMYACTAEQRKAWDKPYDNLDQRKEFVDVFEAIFDTLEEFKFDILRLDKHSTMHSQKQLNETEWVKNLTSNNIRCMRTSDLIYTRNNLIQKARLLFEAIQKVSNHTVLDSRLAKKHTFTALIRCELKDQYQLYYLIRKLRGICWRYFDLVLKMSLERRQILKYYERECKNYRAKHDMLPDENTRKGFVEELIDSRFKQLEAEFAKVLREIKQGRDRLIKNEQEIAGNGTGITANITQNE
ncbi:hypothetical protein PAPHI01_1481 [Pancytospora philotis]|nr:hypothetical protein PAPHI01_1481 [Pancytospora philotis]